MASRLCGEDAGEGLSRYGDFRLHEGLNKIQHA